MRITLLITLFLAGSIAFPQDRFRPIGKHMSDLPPWATLMYAEDPKVREVEEAYKDWFNAHPFEKTVHTQYYKF